MLKKIFIGAGSNIGNSFQIIEKSLKLLISDNSTSLITASSFYSSKAIGYVNQPDFINAVFCVKSQLKPLPLLKKLLEIEDVLGRERTFKNAPRCIDLDLLIYENTQQKTDGSTPLILPHPEIQNRAFVLKPLIEIEPNCIIPGLGKAAKYMVNCKNQKINRLKKKIKS